MDLLAALLRLTDGADGVEMVGYGWVVLEGWGNDARPIDTFTAMRLLCTPQRTRNLACTSGGEGRSVCFDYRLVCADVPELVVFARDRKDADSV